MTNLQAEKDIGEKFMMDSEPKTMYMAFILTTVDRSPKMELDELLREVGRK